LQKIVHVQNRTEANPARAQLCNAYFLLTVDLTAFWGCQSSNSKGWCSAFQCKLFVLNKYFLPNYEKNGADPSCRFWEKRKKRTLLFRKM